MYVRVHAGQMFAAASDAPRHQTDQRFPALQYGRQRSAGIALRKQIDPRVTREARIRRHFARVRT